MNIKNLTKNELNEYILSINESKYRTNQIFTWLHKKNISAVDEMTNISNELKKQLELDFSFDTPYIYKEYKSNIDDTRKYLIKLTDGNIIESVLMKYDYGYSICISTEVGCGMGCSFCASTIGGFYRNLEVYEMLSKIYLIEKYNNVKISNIVLMGSGEPLVNFDNLIKFLYIINDEDGRNISFRNITISTCGIVEGILKLSKYNLPITLALSLHAPNDIIRKKIMKIANRYSIDEILKSMTIYYNTTKRRITIEYTLIKNVNDSIVSANELVSLMKKYFINNQVNFNINIIPVNPVKENNYERPSKKTIENFKNNLIKNKINVTIRKELGNDISGSCGQLRASISNI